MSRNQRHPSVRKLILGASAIAMTLACTWSATAGQASKGEQAEGEQYQIRLRARVFTPKAGIRPGFAERAGQALQQGQRRHVYVQFVRLPDPLQRELLEEAGLKLLGFVGSRTWQAVVSQPEALKLAPKDRASDWPGIRWIGPILAKDKQSRYLKKDWDRQSRTSDGKRPLIVHFFDDVSKQAARELLKGLDAEVLNEVPIGNELIAALPDDRIGDLAEQDAVSWIEPVPPPGRPESDRARAHIQVDRAQMPPPAGSGLDGTDVRVGVFEAGHVADGHPDLTGRVTKGDSDPWNRDFHPTATGGFIAGDGARSTTAVGGGTANQYRGMAPAAQLFTYDFWIGESPPWPDAYANYLSDLLNAINSRNIDIGNNSWGTTGGCSVIDYGDYTELCDDLDTAVAGAGEYERPAIIVFSAGNERDGIGGSTDTSCLVETTFPFRNYDTLNHPKSAKNVIVVGAVDSHNDRMTAYSSWGPTDDGRIKPDVVASGHHNGTLQSGVTEIDNLFGSPFGAANQQGYRLPNYPFPPASTYMYGWFTSTSAAAAATSGAIALLVEAHRELLSTEIDPLPSTVRAMLVQTARDLSDATEDWYNPGPDYASGYGLVQIHDAIELIGSGKIIEGKIVAGRPDAYTIEAPAGTTSLKFTLAWDDPAPTPGAADILVNDLDLVVTDPDGNRYFPWTLDPSAADADAVRTGADHRNNLEQVEIDTTLVPGTTLPVGAWEIRVEPHSVPVGPQRYSLVGSERLAGAVDVMLVLDRSGSMNGMASPGMPDTKIHTLRSAATQLVDVMLVDAGYMLGLVQFNQNVVPSPPEADLDLHTTARAPQLRNAISLISAGGRTSIGDGLRDALNQLTTSPSPPGIDRVILLVTDGKENEPEWISGVRSDLVAEDVTVNVLGLGYGSGIDEAKLTDLAGDTDGTYRITADHLVFRKLFIEALAGVVDWSMVADPVGRLGAGEEAIVPFTLAADETRATVTAYWEGAGDAIELSLISPSGRVIEASTTNLRIRYAEDARYALFHLDFPLAGELAGEWPGQWKAKLVGSSQLDRGRPVMYTASVFAEGGVTLAVEPAPLTYLTGKPIQILARLERADQFVPHAQIKVVADVPLVAVGNLLHKPTVAFDRRTFEGDPVSPLAQKLGLLTADGAEGPKRGTKTFKLFDDGKHNDGKPNDGVYGSAFKETRVPGSYSFRLVASKIPAGRGKTTREASYSVYNAVRIDPEHSEVRIERVGGGKNRFKLWLEPRDEYGNYLGPGHTVQGVLTTAIGRMPVAFKDGLDGRYTSQFALSTEEHKAKTHVRILIDRRFFTNVVVPIR